MMELIKNILPAAIQQNSGQVQLRTRHCETIEQKQFESALLGKRMCECTEDEMKQGLRFVYVLVGLRAQNYPSGIEKQVLHAFIFKHYGEHTTEEIKLAFEMAITQKLDLRPEDIPCYENFSIAYFSRIIEAYRSWAREQVKQLPAPEEKPREYTMEEKLQLDLDYAFYCLNQIKNSLIAPLKNDYPHISPKKRLNGQVTGKENLHQMQTGKGNSKVSP